MNWISVFDRLPVKHEIVLGLDTGGVSGAEVGQFLFDIRTGWIPVGITKYEERKPCVVYWANMKELECPVNYPKDKL